MENEQERFVQKFEEVEITHVPSDLKDELNKNLAAMENKNLSDRMFVQLSERNIEIQNMLLKEKQAK